MCSKRSDIPIDDWTHTLSFASCVFYVDPKFWSWSEFLIPCTVGNSGSRILCNSGAWSWDHTTVGAAPRTDILWRPVHAWLIPFRSWCPPRSPPSIIEQYQDPKVSPNPSTSSNIHGQQLRTPILDQTWFFFFVAVAYKKMTMRLTMVNLTCMFIFGVTACSSQLCCIHFSSVISVIPGGSVA